MKILSFERRPGQPGRGYTILYYNILYYTIIYYTLPYTIYHIPYTIYHILCTIYYVLYTLYFIPYTIHYTLYTLHYTLYTIHYTLYTIHYATHYATLCYALLHPVSITKFPSFRTQPLEHLSVDSVKNAFLSNPAPGENLESGNLVMETGCRVYHSIL